MRELTITISLSSDGGGYYYDIYDFVPEIEATSFDGGMCTTTIENALDMATK